MTERQVKYATALKITASAILIFSLFRLAVICTVTYFSYSLVIEKQTGVPITRSSAPIDPNVNGKISTTASENEEESMTEKTDLTTQDWGDSETTELLHNNQESLDNSPSLLTVASVVLVLAEIVSSLMYTFIIIGPASKRVSIRRWLLSLFKLRITWERLLWVAVVIVYSYVYGRYRTDIYKETSDKQYYDTPLEVATGWIACAEYATLGVTESVIVLLTPRRIERALTKAKETSGKFFGTIVAAAYLTCNAAFAIRNLAICLYFALLAVYVTQNEQEQMGSSNVGIFTVIVVLQAMLSIIRANYGNVFLGLTLGYFLDEGENFSAYICRMEDEQKDNGNRPVELQNTYRGQGANGP